MHKKIVHLNNHKKASFVDSLNVEIFDKRNFCSTIVYNGNKKIVRGILTFLQASQIQQLLNCSCTFDTNFTNSLLVLTVANDKYMSEILSL
jgi:hypothetical protein